MIIDPKDKLSSCHNDLQVLLREVGALIDVCVCCGHRSKEEQNAAFKGGKSKVKWPNSKHNTYPSLAVDLAPVADGKIDWGDSEAFDRMAEVVLEVANQLGIGLEWGGNWESFKDKPHFQIRMSN